MAFVVVAAVAWLIREVLDNPQRSRPETTAAVVLGGLVLLQLLLGVETWLSKFSTQTASEWHQLQPLALHAQLVRSLHLLVGALVFASAVSVAWQVHRRLILAVQHVPAPAGRLEGAA